MSESPSRIEPCGIEEMIPEALSDLVVQIRQEASEIGRGLPTQTLRDLRGLVRIMNAYYSNLIEGHNTRPRDIEAALRGEAVENRPLAEEAAAHVRVQEWIDGLADAGNLPSPVSVEFIAAVHARFYAEMPDEFRHVKQNGRQVDIVPGVFRAVHVQVGRHLPPAPDAVPAFMTYFAQRYTSLTRGATGRILGNSGGASPPQFYPPVSGREWPGQSADQPCHDPLGRDRRGRALVDFPRSGTGP